MEHHYQPFEDVSDKTCYSDFIFYYHSKRRRLLSPNRVLHKTQNLFCVGVQELYYQKVKTDVSQTRHEKESLAQLVRPTSAVASTCFSVNETSAEVV